MPPVPAHSPGSAPPTATSNRPRGTGGRRNDRHRLVSGLRRRRHSDRKEHRFCSQTGYRPCAQHQELLPAPVGRAPALSPTALAAAQQPGAAHHQESASAEAVETRRTYRHGMLSSDAGTPPRLPPSRIHPPALDSPIPLLYASSAELSHHFLRLSTVSIREPLANPLSPLRQNAPTEWNGHSETNNQRTPSTSLVRRTHHHKPIHQKPELSHLPPHFQQIVPFRTKSPTHSTVRSHSLLRISLDVAEEA